MEDTDLHGRYDPWRAEISVRMRHMQEQIEEGKRAVEVNTKMTADIKRNTDDIVLFFEAGRGTFKALKVIGIIAKWVTTVAAAVAVAFLIWKGGKP